MKETRNEKDLLLTVMDIPGRTKYQTLNLARARVTRYRKRKQINSQTVQKDEGQTMNRLQIKFQRI